MRKESWVTVLHLIFWLFAYLLISPLPLGMGEMQMGGMGEAPLAIILIYSFLIDALIVYSYTRKGLPHYLKNPRLRTFLILNFSYLIGFASLKALLDWVFGVWVGWYVDLESDSMLFHFLEGTQGAIVSGETPASFLEWLMVNVLTTTIILFLANAYGFISDWWKERRIHHTLEREKLVMELSALKNQINPHFLFNILNGLYAMALKNEDEPTAMGIEKLSRMMRYVLYESNGNSVMLSQEIEYIENYIDLQRMRVGSNVNINFAVEGVIQSKTIAPMLFIPFIENAFKHGISTAKPSQIDIKLSLDEDVLQFEVKNMIHQNPLSDAKGYHGIGLDNVRKRLDLLYQGKYILKIEGLDKTFLVQLNLTL